ncbi:tautomerase family protein [Aeromicrobium sp. PE09-221]|uniref:tautomerase family protein n=1 Tax=Aeromicrobium sp. PE09-221 TaxID=1898043 RepID=UPI000B3EAFB0|nr:tautomerase family protein [Aeromicrobium sp. PE09-221]OUZ12155.1 tautomerase family protein [Aeromicrobium sp. PE09-221]
MPSTVIEVRRSYETAEEIAIIDAVHEALVVAFRIPEKDKHIRLIVHEPHRFATPPDLSHADRATMVTIDCFAGRSADAKRRLYAEIVRRLEVHGIPADHVTIVVRDLELGFEVEV